MFHGMVLTYMSSSYAVSIIVETPDGIPLVLDPKKPIPRYWKFPGGRNEAGESPQDTASRELKEETGIQIEADKLVLLHFEERSDHNFFLFQAKLETTPTLLAHSPEGEQIQLFPREGIKNMPDFFPSHRSLAEKFLP